MHRDSAPHPPADTNNPTAVSLPSWNKTAKSTALYNSRSLETSQLHGEASIMLQAFPTNTAVRPSAYLYRSGSLSLTTPAPANNPRPKTRYNSTPLVQLAAETPKRKPNQNPKPKTETHPLEELEGVLAVLQHELRQAASHLHYSADLVVVRHPRKYRQPQKHLHRDATQRPDVDGAVVRQAQENLDGRGPDHSANIHTCAIQEMQGEGTYIAS